MVYRKESRPSWLTCTRVNKILKKQTFRSTHMNTYPSFICLKQNGSSSFSYSILKSVKSIA